MNAAFRRSEAVETLESYAPVVALHLTMLLCFPKHQEKSHWKKELKAFQKVYRRYNHGKKGRTNFEAGMIVDSLEDVLWDFEGKERIVNAIVSKGLILDFDDVDWKAVRKAIGKFAVEVLEGK
ncbi:MAG: hypothetical protein HYW48_06105 [Deltaproteobacteria bacterium]|nr:hypothetical protein [Deltaproteobacteria bacterium]